MGESKSDSCYVMCKECSHPILLTNGFEYDVDCERCGCRNHKADPKSASWSLAFTFTALILYIPANIYPFMTIELYGNRNTSTIWGGIVSLYQAGSWPIALIVLLASLVIPFFKLIILFYLALTANGNHPHFKTKLYNIVEAIGRWSMLDIFLLAVLVAIMKLGPWTQVRPEMGSLLFAMVVIFTMLGSAYFDPQLLWENKNGDSTAKKISNN